jgi:aldose 1-epimerase
MRATEKRVGRAEDGTLTTYTIENDDGMSVTILNRGATLMSVNVPDARGAVANVTLGFPTPAEYAHNDVFFGCIVGRFANRIGGARFTLDGREYTLARNNGANHLHGGPRGYDKALWRGSLFTRPGLMGVRFRHTSRDGDEGYPGTLKLVAEYGLSASGELSLEYWATTSAPTPVNITNHAYWNLAGAGSGLVLDHELSMSCPFYLPVDEGLIPTGEVRPVAGTPFDFSRAKSIGRDMGGVPGGYDHCMVVGKIADSLGEACIARDPSSGRTMTVRTTKPGLQLYTGNFLPGTPFPRHGGFCIETQHFPDSVNKGHFPSCVLRPGATYHHRTVYAFAAT